MIKLLHTGDLHLSYGFVGLDPEKRKARLKEHKESLKRIVELANTREVDYLLITGDLFDRANVDKSLLDYVKYCFAGFGGTKIIILPGNHDPYIVNGVYASNTFPQNVYIFDEENSILREEKATFYGFAYYKDRIPTNKLEDLEMGGGINILLHHGASEIAGEGYYMPFTIEDLERLSPSYGAFGHHHAHKEIYRNCYYSGSPEAFDFKNPGDRGVLYVEVTELDTKVEFIQTGTREYRALDVYANPEDDLPSIAQRIGKLINEQDAFKISIKGEVSPELVISKEEIVAYLQKYFYVEIIDNTEIAYAYYEEEHSKDIIGAYVSRLKELIEQNNSEKYKLALKLGVRELLKGVSK